MIDIQPGQFCVINSGYGFRVVRADKVTPKQIRRRRNWCSGYDLTSREKAVFAGTEGEAQALCGKLVEAHEEFRKNKSAAEREYHEKCEPFKAAYHAQVATFNADYAARRAALLAEMVPA